MILILHTTYAAALIIIDTKPTKLTHGIKMPLKRCHEQKNRNEYEAERKL